MEPPKKVLFVCFANSCRSPIAEGVFRKTVNKRGQGHEWEIDSAGIGSWHIGKPPSWRSMAVMKKYNVPYSNVARQITTEDFHYYDYILCMDNYNMHDLKQLAPEGLKAMLALFGDFDPQGERIIRDPYFDDSFEGFEECYEQCVRCAGGFLETNCPTKRFQLMCIYI